MIVVTMQILNAAATAAALPWAALVRALGRTLADARAGQAQVPERQVLSIAPTTAWLLMPAWLHPEAGDLAAIKLITYNVANPARGLPAILGDVLVLRASTGERLAMLDGPTVTARRTAAVSLLAAQNLAPNRRGPLLLIGTGVQALAHAQAFASGLGVREVQVIGRTPDRASEFAAALCGQGLNARPAGDLVSALRDCPLVVTATPALAVCLSGRVRDDAFVAAIGAFTPTMIELDPALTRHIAAHGQVLIDSANARHEAGDLIAAGLDLAALPTLQDLQSVPVPTGPVLFKSCGSALWDLAAARCVADGLATSGISPS